MGSRPRPHVGHVQQKARVVRVADPDPMWVPLLVVFPGSPQF